MNDDLRQRLLISADRVDALNAVLMSPDMRVINDFLAVVAKYGTPEEINAKALAARQAPALRQKASGIAPFVVRVAVGL